MPGLGQPARPPQLPRRGGAPDNWDAFWNVLLVDRRVLQGRGEAYEPTVEAFMDAFEHLVRVDPREIPAAGEGTVRALDGTRVRIATFVPRLLFTTASVTSPDRQILRPLPTYYALP
jgi:hypothetical protein